MDETQIRAGVRRMVDMIRANLAIPEMNLRLTRTLVETGEPVDVARLAAAGGWSVKEVRAELARHPGIDWDEHGQIVGFGATLRPTGHSFTNGERTVYAWCASDALQFPFALGPGLVESTCPTTGKRVRVQVTPERVVDVDPAEAVVSKVRPLEAVADSRADLCELGNFLASPESATEWLAAYPQGEVVPIADEFEIVRRAGHELGWITAPAPPGVGDDGGCCAM
jgi:alkylmercury lyase